MPRPNCPFSQPGIWVFLITLKSVSKNLGPRNWLRIWLPNTVGAPVEGLKAAVARHCLSTVQTPLCPTPISLAKIALLGPKLLAERADEAAVSITVSGNPLRENSVPDNCHPCQIWAGPQWNTLVKGISQR